MSTPQDMLRRHVDRRQVIKAGGLIALGLIYNKPLIDTIRPVPLFAQYGEPETEPPLPPPETSFQLVKTLVSPSSAFDDNFGFSVAAVAGNVLVGEPHNDAGASSAGAVHLFDGSPLSATFGELLKTFFNPAPMSSANFGRSVAGVGKRLLAGAPQADKAFLFDGDPTSPTFGNLLHTFQNPNPSGLVQFGFAVTGVGENVLIGVRRDDTTGVVDSGEAFLFDGDPSSASFGNLLHTFTNPNPSDTDHFGWSVAAVGTNVLVGAPLDDTAKIDAGAVYLFDGDPSSPAFGSLLTTFVSPTPNTGIQFGSSVSAVGNSVLIGADKDNTGANGSGIAYLFDGDPSSPSFGSLLLRFLNPTPEDSDEFGFSVADASGHALIGTRAEDTGASDAGAVYLFDSVGSPPFGTLLHKFLNPNPIETAQFGYSVTSAGELIVIGALNGNPGVSKSGAVYLFFPD